MKKTLQGPMMADYSPREHAEILRWHLHALRDEDGVHPFWCGPATRWEDPEWNCDGCRFNVSIYDGDVAGLVDVQRRKDGRMFIYWNGANETRLVEIGEAWRTIRVGQGVDHVHVLVKAMADAQDRTTGWPDMTHEQADAISDGRGDFEPRVD
jgi:hypothetical protein